MDLESLNTGIIVLDSDAGKISSMNNSATKILGWDIKTLNENFHNLTKLSAGLLALTKVIKDIKSSTELKKLEVSINSQQYNLYLQKTKEGILLELTQIIYQDMKQTTHELKRPIQNIKTLVETLQMGAKNDSVKCDEYLSKLNYEADRLGTMVQDMLSLSHVLSGSVALELTAIDLYARVEKLLALASSRASARNIELMNQIKKATKIFADAKFFDHMLGNLIDNAIKYNVEGGKVYIEFVDGKLIVKDTGRGIPESDLERVFEQFYRVKETQAIQGSGLGLAIVKAIVDLHEWSISIESELDQGTSFIINIKNQE